MAIMWHEWHMSMLQERLAPSAMTHPMFHPYDTKQQAVPHGS